MPKSLFQRKSLYNNLLIYFMVSIILITLLSSFTFYVNYEKHELENIYSYSLDSLNQISYSADFMVESAKTLMSQIYTDADITRLLFQVNQHPIEEMAALRKLNSYQATMPLVHSVYIYNRRSNQIYSSLAHNSIQSMENFFDKEILQILDNFDRKLVSKPLPRRLPQRIVPGNQTQISNVFSFIFTGMTNKDGNPDNAIIINVSELWMRKVMDSLNKKKDGSIFIIDTNGKIVSSIYKDNILTNLSSTSYVRDILQSKSSSGYFVDRIDNSKQLITYVTSSCLEWIFVRTTPYRIISDRLAVLRFNTILLCVIVIVFGLVFSYITSKRAYKPIDTILSTLKQQVVASRKNLYSAKQEFLRGLLQNSTPISEEKLNLTFKEFEIGLECSSTIILVLFKIDNYISEFCTRYGLEDRKLLKFAAMNIICEISNSLYKNEAIDDGDDRIVLLLNIDRPLSDQAGLSIYKLIKDIQALVKNHLQFQLSAALISTNNHLSNINSLYEQALDISYHRLFHGHECVLCSDKINLKSVSEYIYPAQKEKMLIDSLMLSKPEDSRMILKEMLESTICFPSSVVNLTLLHITFAVSAALDAFERSGGYCFGINISSFINNLTQMETLDDILIHFDTLFLTIEQKIKYKKGNKHNELTLKVMEIINTSYMEDTLCLNGIAETIGISPSYLGKIFKQHTFKSISDYINEVRLENAKKLLQSTNISIKCISNKVGFSNSNYFFNVFKKAYGVTPNEYRQNNTDNNI